MQTSLLIIAGLLLFIWLLLRRRNTSTAKDTPPAPAAKKKTAYHAVSIKLGPRACAAAQNISGQRFLSSEAPQLPLPDCDADECTCHFAHHDDRRSGKDRRSPFAPAGFGGGTGSFQKERRERPERRKDAGTDHF